MLVCNQKKNCMLLDPDMNPDMIPDPGSPCYFITRFMEKSHEELAGILFIMKLLLECDLPKKLQVSTRSDG